MNKTLKLAFGAVLGTMLVIPALAQDQFPDVPENHWVYDALLNMKNEGILVGYPDGRYRGGRAATRYELAGAINAAYQKLKGMISGLSSRIDSMQGMGDLDAIKAELASLKSQLAGMSRYGDDIAALQRMASTFEKDLAGLGVDVEAMKKDLADLATRVGNLEKHKPAVDIHGDVTAIMLAGASDDGLPGITVDFRLTGVNDGSLVGMDKDLNIGHEAAFTFTGTNDTGPKWHATLVAGNLIGGDPASDVFFGNQSNIMAGSEFDDSSPTSLFFQDFGVTFDTSIWGQGFTMDIGRWGHQSGRYFYQRLDNSPYMESPRWDDGNWTTDGFLFGLGRGRVGLDVWVGRTSHNLMPTGGTFDPGATTVGGHPFEFVWQMTAGPQNFFGEGDLLIDRVLGADLNLSLGDTADVMLHYIILEGDGPPVSGDPYNRVNVWGGEANFNLGRRLSFNGGYSQSDLRMNGDAFLTDDNAAYWVQGRFDANAFDLYAGWRHIDPYFGAPGDWGRTGFLWNPVDHEGFYGGVNFNAGSVGVKVDGFWYESLDGVMLPLDINLVGWNAELSFKLFGDWQGMLGWEWAQFQDVGGPGADDTVQWWRVGLRHNMPDGSMLIFKYEMSDYDSDIGPSRGGSAQVAKGSLFTTQWFRKF
jgi:hypothetical protein